MSEHNIGKQLSAEIFAGASLSMANQGRLPKLALEEFPSFRLPLAGIDNDLGI